MGSYTRITGNFTTNTAVNDITLKEIEVKCQLDGVIESSGRLKDDKARKAFKDKYFNFNADWKNCDQDETFDTVKQLYAAFAARNAKILKGVMVCEHEYGDKWKITISDKEITLHIGEVVYFPTKSVKIKVEEKISRAEIVSFV